MTGSTTRTGTIPVPESERIGSLDVLRGFALLGILPMNIGSFSMPAAAYFNPTVYGNLEGADYWVWLVTHLFADLKFMAIFSMLFGAGIVLMDQRCRAKGIPFTGLHYRRMVWLVLFGILHANLLWYGDILYWYGLCGMLVVLFRSLSPKWLTLSGLLFLAVASGFLLSAGLTLDQWPPEAVEEANRDLRPSPEAVETEVEAYRGTWLEQMQERIPEAREMESSAFLFWALWRVAGLMLVGMALFKLGVFSAERSLAFYRIWILVAVGIGLPIVGYGVHWNFARDWASPTFFFLGSQFNYWASLLVALGWVSVVMLVVKARRLTRLTEPLAAVGRTAFSNYILQTLICTTIFYGHGFGLFGSLERTAQLGVVVAVWTLQLVISPLWLRKFRFGPLEWLWRTLVYLQPQPFRRG